MNTRKLLLLTAVLLCGCGDSLPQRIPVEGIVTFNGGPPPAPGYIDFAPLETYGDAPQRPGTAKFDASGQFRVTSFDNDDGLIPGRYVVRIQCWKQEPDPVPGGEEAATYIAPNYQPPELTIAADARKVEPLHYDVPLKSP
jgi:hypothetical protein